MSILLSWCFVLCVLLSFSLCISADTQCKVGGVSYLCPSTLSVLDRWGVQYRRYDIQRLLGYDGHYPGRVITPVTLLNEDVPIIRSYFQGNNTNKTMIPLTMPVAVEIIDLPQYNYTDAVAFMFLPTAIIYGPLPLPYDYNLAPSYLIAPGAMNPIVLQFPDPSPSDDVVNKYFDQLRGILKEHGQDVIPYHLVYASYQSRDPTEMDEVWMFPEDSEYSKMRKQQVLDKLKAQGVDVSAE